METNSDAQRSTVLGEARKEGRETGEQDDLKEDAQRGSFVDCLGGFRFLIVAVLEAIIVYGEEIAAGVIAVVVIVIVVIVDVGVAEFRVALGVGFSSVVGGAVHVRSNDDVLLVFVA